MAVGGLNLSAEDEVVTDIGMWNTVSCLDRLVSKERGGNLKHLCSNPALSR